MLDNKLFGNKDSFAIEIGYSKNPKKFFLRFWIKDQPMGTFKKADSLKFSIEAIKRILIQKEDMFLPVFDNMTTEEIHNYTKIDHNNKEDVKRLDKLVPLYKFSFFGKQFTDTQSEYLILFKNNFFKFIWKNDFDKPLFNAEVSFENFFEVTHKYIEFYESL